MADVNGDGVLDIITGAGAGGGPHVKVFDGATGDVIDQFFAYAADFHRRRQRGGRRPQRRRQGRHHHRRRPRRRPARQGLRRCRPARCSASYFAYAANFHGGVAVAAGDVDGDGKADIVTGAMAGGGPHLRVWHDATGQMMARDVRLRRRSYTGGLSVAVGDFDGDGKADIAVGPRNRRPGPHPRPLRHADRHQGHRGLPGQLPRRHVAGDAGHRRQRRGRGVGRRERRRQAEGDRRQSTATRPT